MKRRSQVFWVVVVSMLAVETVGCGTPEWATSEAVSEQPLVTELAGATSESEIARSNERPVLGTDPLTSVTRNCGNVCYGATRTNPGVRRCCLYNRCGGHRLNSPCEDKSCATTAAGCSVYP